MSNKQYMYMVNYSQGVWDDYVAINIFASHDNVKAQAYVDKFNALLMKWKAYYEKIVDVDNAWLLVHVDAKMLRAYQILEINQAYVEKIEIR